MRILDQSSVLVAAAMLVGGRGLGVGVCGAAEGPGLTR